MESITVGGNAYNLVPTPSTPGPSAIEFGMFDAIGFNPSPYDMTAETLQWPGGDGFDATVTLPSMYATTAAPWRAFLAELRGQLNVFQLQDPSAPLHPLGNVLGSIPVVDSTSPNLATTTTLGTSGWKHSTARVMLRGDRFQLGYRYHMVVEDVSSDSSGNAQVQIWPSLRENPEPDTALVLKTPMALFRLSSGMRRIQWSPSRITTFSISAIEVR
jgi:hypothetical protein